jgi:hypothetical protein
VGTVVAFQASFGLSDLGDPQLDSVEFPGVAGVEFDDGMGVDAAVSNDPAEVLRGGGTVEVAPVGGSECWEVVRHVEE